MTAAAKTDGYHHGNLRAALLDAAQRLVEERGIDGLTLREVARRAGVSHNAPYHHFQDKAALVQALAEDGYEQLLAAELASVDPTATIPEQIRALGHAYVRFALEDPQRFTLMNRPELRREDEVTPVQRAGMASEAPLLDAIAAGQDAGFLAGGDPGLLGLGAWATVHGLAMLLVDGPLRDLVPRDDTLTPLIDGVLDTILLGLEARPRLTP